MPYWIAALALAFSAADLDTGRTLRQAGRLEEAIELFGQLLTSSPEDREAQLELGHTLALAGRYHEAIESYEKLAESKDPGWRTESSKWRGLTYLYFGDIDRCLSRLEQRAVRARQSKDRAGQVHSAWYRGHIYTELDQFGKANTAFLEALELEPDDLNALHLAGIMAARQGDSGSLRYQIEDLQKAVKRSADSAQMRRVHHLEAELDLLRKRPKRALTQIEQAIELFPHPLYRETKARAFLAAGDYPAAESTYREIVTSTDERLDIPLHYVRALLGLARSLDAQGQTEEAVSYYEKFVSHWSNATSPIAGVSAAKARLLELDSSR